GSTLKLITNLQTTIKELQAAFIDKGKEFNHIIKMGRTHLQDAVPIRLGQEFEAYGEVLTRDLNRLEQARKSLLTMNLGATAVGTGLNADPYYIKRSVEIFAQLTRIYIVSAKYLVDATQSTDAYTEMSCTLKIYMLIISNIANDLILMSTAPRASFNELEL